MITAIVIILALILISICPSIIYLVVILAVVALVIFAIAMLGTAGALGVENLVDKNKTKSSNSPNGDLDPDEDPYLTEDKNLNLINNENTNEKEIHEQETSETTAHERED